VAAIYTFDIFSTLTFRQFMQLLGPIDESELDPVNARLRSMPTTVVSTTLEGPFDWPDDLPRDHRSDRSGADL
jgi:hypothetical protein